MNLMNFFWMNSTKIAEKTNLIDMLKALFDTS